VRNCLLFISFFFLFCSCSQEKGETIYSDGKIYKDNGRGYEISDLFKLTGDSVFSSDRKLIKIRLPKNLKVEQTAWGSFHIGGFIRAKTKWEVFYLISDLDSANPQIMFDKNGNADFTDDTVSIIQPDSSFYVNYKNPQDRNAEFKAEYKFYRGTVDSSRIKIHKVLTHNLGVTLLPTYMMLAKRYDIKKIKLADGNIVSMRDVDFDGMFTSKYDKIIAGDLSINPGLLSKPLQCKDLKKGAELPFGNNTYKVVSIDKYGNSLSLKALNKVIDTIERLPLIKYTDINNSFQELALRTDKQYSVLYIWGTWCIGCLYQSKGFADLMNKYDSIANFYSLNTGDSKDKMIKYIKDKNYPFQPYRINKETAEEKLFADAFPTFIVADETKKILLRTSSVDEVGRFMKEKVLSK
jgi:thiol-disulfide isomerase/thioredoxin